MELLVEWLARELGRLGRVLLVVVVLVFSCLLSRVGVAVGPPKERRETRRMLMGVDSETDSLKRELVTLLSPVRFLWLRTVTEAGMCD